MVSAIDFFKNTPTKNVLATNDPGESKSYAGPSNPGAVAAWQGSGRKIYLRWVAPSGDNGKLQFISKAGFPFNPSDFASTPMNFAADNNPGFNSGCVDHLITL